MSLNRKKHPWREEEVPAVKRAKMKMVANSVACYATPAHLTGELHVVKPPSLAGTFTKAPAVFCVAPAEVDEGAAFSFDLLSTSVVPTRQLELRSKSPFSRVK